MMRKLISILSALLLLITLGGFTLHTYANESAEPSDALFTASENTVDTTVLEEILDKFPSYRAADYTESSYQNLKSLYDTYSDALNTMTEQAEVDAAVFELLEAVSNLKAYLSLQVGCNLEGVSPTVSIDGNTPSADSTHTVIFGTEVTVSVTEAEGYMFVGWLETVSKRILDDNYSFTFHMSVKTSLQAIFIKEGNSAIAYLSKGDQIMAIMDKSPSEWAQVSDLAEIAPRVPYAYGYTNGRWDYSEGGLQELIDGQFISAYPIYDTADVPQFDLLDHTADKAVLELHYHYDGDAGVGSFIMRSHIPYQLNVTSVGMLFYYKKAASFHPETFDVTINNKMLTSQFDYLYEDGYITNMRSFTAKYNWAVKGYITYFDDGQLKTLYSNQVNITNLEDEHRPMAVPAVAATCTEAGLTEGSRCFICGEVFTQQEAVAPLGHDYIPTVTEPTCTENGFITYRCSRCDDGYTVHSEYNPDSGEYTHPELIATGHDYGEYLLTTPATITALGEATSTCSNCGATRTQPVYVAEGTCGENATYAFDHRTGVLTISGQGAMTDYVKEKSPFTAADNITRIVIENGITKIGNYAFYQCAALESISIPEGLTDIGIYALNGCSSLQSTVLPSTLLSIGDSAFMDCENLQCALPSGLQSLSSSAFRNCSSLNNIVLPSALTSVSPYAFYGCSLLSTVTLHDGITKIGNYAFYGCASLSELYISRYITNIGNAAFAFCSGLNSITVDENNTVYDSRNNANAIIKTADNALITGCCNTVIPETVQVIEARAFMGCSRLTEITIPSSVYSIKSYAFSDCTALEHMELPPNVTVINSSTFNNCTALETVTLSQRTTSIASRAFYHCSSLTEIDLPIYLTSVGAYAFNGCDALTDIYVRNINCTLSDSPTTLPETTTIHSLLSAYARDYAVKYHRPFQSLSS